MPPSDSWTYATLRVPAEAEDLLSDLLTVAAGEASVVLHGAAHQGTDKDSGQDLWMIYTDTQADLARLLKALPGACAELGLEDPASHPVVVGTGIQLREPWHEAWREHFHPVQVGGIARIVPPWHRGTTPADGPPEIVIEPGMAFGTGTHPTTQLALTLTTRELRSRSGSAVLDIGTGSGILAIAALRHGAARVTATDLDPDVAANVMENLRLNGLLDAGEDVLEPTTAMAILANHELLRLHLGPLTPLPGSPGLEVLPPPWSGPFDLILCNMLQHEFTPLLKSFPRLLDRDGVAILSGFLVRDWEELLADLETAELMPVGALEEQGEWGGIVVAPRR